MEHFALFEFIRRAREVFFFRVLYWIARIGMGMAFVISGIRKLPGVRFTILPEENPVGHFFNAMHETGFYWNFIGYIQILLGILLFFNRSAILSILIMMPITLNIFLVSIALKMGGTPVITAMMLAGNLFLLFWHYEHFLPILNRATPVRIGKD